MAAIYCADIFCDDCADHIKRQIGRDIWNTASRTVLPDGTLREDFDSLDDLWDYLDSMNESDYDSGDYPKYCSDNEESDSPQHCGSHDDCINHGTLPDGFKYGYCFGNSLTSEGEDYVKEAVRDGGDDGVARLVWAVEYDYLDFEDEPVDDDFTITPTGPLGGKSGLGRVNGGYVGEYDNDDDAIDAARAIMEEESYYPNVWIVSDHGNWTLYTE